MPTNRKRRTRHLLPQVPDAVTEYLRTGDLPEVPDFPLYVLLRAPDRLRSVWRDVRREILSAWLRDHPCSRPWAWWEVDGRREPVDACPGFSAAQRRRVGGTGDPDFATLAVAPQFCFGIPDTWIELAHMAAGFDGVLVDEADPPTFESEAAYLDRHGLLTAAEQKHLAAHPELLAPEAVTFEE